MTELVFRRGKAGMSLTGSFVGGKTGKESPKMQSKYTGMRLGDACANGRVLDRRRGMDPDMRLVVS